MVNVVVFAPSPDQLDYIGGLLRRMQTDVVRIEAIHHFGNAEFLKHLDPYDVLVARGITCRMLRGLYPDKHIVELSFDGMDIMEALFRCQKDFHPRRIGLCLQHDNLRSLLPELEQLFQTELLYHDVIDEESAYAAVDACLQEGADAIVSGGTVSNICQERGVHCTYVRIRPATLERAMQEALNAARLINTEQTKDNIIRMILDNSEEAVLAADETGHVLEANNQAYQLYGLAFVPGWKGRSVRDLNDGLTFIGSRESPCRDGEEQLVRISGQQYQVRYRLISGEGSSIGTLITTSPVSEIFKPEQRMHKSLPQKGLSAKYTFRNIIAVNPEMRKKVEIAKKFSKADSDVLITGETGTGKELFAHSIHSASGRAAQPFVAINCATLPETLLESELFGYEPGSFSGASKEGRVGLFELAHRGTIFLDEIGEIPVSLQAKLLRVLQEKEIRRIGSQSVIPVDVRVIAATNINIRERIAQERFRSDLLYRLNALEISIPPLRERPEDVIPLMEDQLFSLAAGIGKKVPRLTVQAQEILRRYSWPGNVRELRNICGRLVVLSDAADVTAETLSELHAFFENTSTPSTAPPPLPCSPAKTKKELARELGVSRTTLWRMTKRQEEQGGPK